MLHNPSRPPGPRDAHQSHGAGAVPPSASGPWARRGTHLLGHGIKVGDAAAEVQDVGSGQRQLHSVDVGLLGRGSRSLHAREATGCGTESGQGTACLHLEPTALQPWAATVGPHHPPATHPGGKQLQRDTAALPAAAAWEEASRQKHSQPQHTKPG